MSVNSSSAGSAASAGSVAGSASSSDRSCSVLLSYDVSGLVKEMDYQSHLESKDDDTKIEALKALISALSNGDQMPKLLMSVIKYCLNSENHVLKKLLLLYWEVVEKKTKDGNLLHEMILVCNAMKNNLTHPNEYIRGSTLRFLCKIKEAEILESLVPSIIANLEHRHSYVRKNAVLTVHSVFESFPELIPDAPDLIDQFLSAETNPAAKRNAFLMLFHCSQDRAVNFISSIIQTISSLGESFQLSILELIRKVCRSNPSAKSQYIRCIFGLVNSPSPAVAFEGANTLIALSAAPTAVRAAVTAYTQLLAKESDNNVKLIILGRLAGLRKRNEKILQEQLMDILRVLATPNPEIRKKTLELAFDLVNARNVNEFVQLLKKELVRSQSPESASASGSAGKQGELYRKLLVEMMHKCAVKFNEIVPTVVNLLIQYIGDESTAAALDVVYFLREIVEEYSALRDSILTQILENFDEIRSAEVYRVALWIIGEYANDGSALESAISKIKIATANLNNSSKSPDDADRPLESAADAEAKSAGPKKPIILADGTYQSQSNNSIMDSKEGTKPPVVAGPSLRHLLLSGDYFLSSTLAATLTKLVLRFASISGFGSPEANEEIAQAALTMVGLLRVGSGPHSIKPIDPDSQQKIILCIKNLMEPEVGVEVFSSRSREVFSSLLKSDRDNNLAKTAREPMFVLQPDDLIIIRQLKNRAGMDEDLIDDEEIELSKATANRLAYKDTASKLSRVHQLTGFSDPVYVETGLTVQDYDIALDFFIVNLTGSIMQNLTIELNTSGDLKLVDRPQPITIPPNGAHRLHATIKLSSTEKAIIFGNAVYENAAGTNKTIIVLNNIHMDIMDYIAPASCSDQAFRSMWSEFEWENKVAVNTEIAELNDYLKHILSITNMKCMTPDSNLSGSCNFLAANLYARSMFSEDALLNLSVEKQKNGKISGFIRIRSKTQGIALSLGDKITDKQRGNKS